MKPHNPPTPQKNEFAEKNSTAPRIIQSVIGVMSSKGGVGKSCITAMLAVELARMGYKVGILDSDLSGASLALLFGVHGPLKAGTHSLLPLETASGIKIISANLLIENADQAVVWKEALAGKVIDELFRAVEWGNLDYLLVDMPPATTEVAVAIMQSIPFSGAVVVTQPQELSARIVAKAAQLIDNIGIDIIGVVENCSYYRREADNGRQYLFGPSHVAILSNLAGAPILAQIPFTPKIIELCDTGKIEDIELVESLKLCEAVLNRLTSIGDKTPAFQSTEPETLASQNQSLSEEILETPPPFQMDDHTGQTFSDVVLRLIRNKDNLGVLDHPDAQGYFIGSCGDRMQIELEIVGGKILSANFLADGCGATLACGSMITKMACAKTLAEATKITAAELIAVLNGLPDDHLHCADLAVMTLREAIIDAVEGHRNRAA